LLGRLGRLAAATATAAGSDHDAARRGLDLVHFLEISAQLNRLRDGQSSDLIAEVFDVGRKFRHCSVSFLSGKTCMSSGCCLKRGSGCVIAKAQVKSSKPKVQSQKTDRRSTLDFALFTPLMRRRLLPSFRRST